MPKDNEKRITSAARSALADAVAGVVGSLVALFVFYPIDLMKTNLQASHQPSSIHGRYEETQEEQMKQSSSDTKKILSFSCKGLHYKTAHTVVSSFAYYFIYSWIFQKWNNLQNPKREKPSTATRLILSAMAAMINVVFTLPLDVLAARSQTLDITTSTQEFHDDGDNHTATAALTTEKSSNTWSSEQELMDDVWNGIETSITAEYHHEPSTLSKKEKQHMSIPSFSKPFFRVDTMNQPFPKQLLKSISSILPPPNDNIPFNRHTITHLWSGLKPALLLCTNPSIHFTIFDSVKDMVLKYKSNPLQQPYQHGQMMKKGPIHHLTMMEAFVIGLFAKFVATMLTYPLIRVKVLLMVAHKSQQITKKVGSKNRNDDEHITNTSNDQGSTLCKQPKDSMRSILIDIFEKDGMVGLYKGCTLQLLHTLLKSALSMMIRERVTEVTQKLIH